MRDTDRKLIREQIAGSARVLVGLGEEWRLGPEGENRQALLSAYEALYQLLKDKDYFIITMAADGLIFDTPLGSRAETVFAEEKKAHAISCPEGVENERTRELMERYFPGVAQKGSQSDSRSQRITAPCGEESQAQWDRYTHWLADTLNRELVILELGTGFENPGLIRFAFEKTCYFNQKARMYRVHRALFQVAAELGDRAVGVQEASLPWVTDLAADV